MKRLLFVAIGVFALAASASAADIETFVADPLHSKILFKARHLGISSVTGQFKLFEAGFKLDPEDLSTLTVEASIDVASIETQVADRDQHLRSADFFDAEKHPKMLFKSTGVEVAGQDRVKIHGDLTIRGVTRPVTLDAVFGGLIRDPWGNRRAGFTASGTVNRKDFGVSWHQILDTGVPVVADEVRVEIEIEATSKGASPTSSGSPQP